MKGKITLFNVMYSSCVSELNFNDYFPFLQFNFAKFKISCYSNKYTTCLKINNLYYFILDIDGNFNLKFY